MRRGWIPSVWREERGFSLIELLGVAVIAIILALFLLPYTSEVMDRVKESRAERDLREIQVALERFYADHGHYPRKLSDLLGFADDKGQVMAYLKHNTKFESPFSTKVKRVYYFYALDNNRTDQGSLAQAYVLADPGPRPASKVGSEVRYSQSGPVPNGRKPTDTAYAWACALSDTQLSLDELDMNCSDTETTLRAYRHATASPRVRTEG